MAGIGGLGGLGGYAPVRTQEELRQQMMDSKRGANDAVKQALSDVPTQWNLANALGMSLFEAEQELKKASSGGKLYTGGDAAWDARVKSQKAQEYGKAIMGMQPGSSWRAPDAEWGDFSKFGNQLEKMGYTGPTVQDIARYGLSGAEYRYAQAEDLAPWNRPDAIRFGYEPTGFGNYEQRAMGAQKSGIEDFYNNTPNALSPEAFEKQATEAQQAQQRVNSSYQDMQGGSFFGGMLNEGYGKPAPGWGTSMPDPNAAPTAGGETPAIAPDAPPTQFGAWRPEQQFNAGWGKKGAW